MMKFIGASSGETFSRCNQLRRLVASAKRFLLGSSKKLYRSARKLRPLILPVPPSVYIALIIIGVHGVGMRFYVTGDHESY